MATKSATTTAIQIPDGFETPVYWNMIPDIAKLDMIAKWEDSVKKQKDLELLEKDNRELTEKSRIVDTMDDDTKFKLAEKARITGLKSSIEKGLNENTEILDLLSSIQSIVIKRSETVNPVSGLTEYGLIYEYYDKPKHTVLPAQEKGKVPVIYRKMDNDNKVVGEWTGRGVVPTWILDELSIEFSNWSEDKIKGSITSKYKEKGWTEKDHKAIMEYMEKYKI